MMSSDHITWTAFCCELTGLIRKMALTNCNKACTCSSRYLGRGNLRELTTFFDNYLPNCIHHAIQNKGLKRRLRKQKRDYEAAVWKDDDDSTCVVVFLTVRWRLTTVSSLQRQQFTSRVSAKRCEKMTTRLSTVSLRRGSFWRGDRIRGRSASPRWRDDENKINCGRHKVLFHLTCSRRRLRGLIVSIPRHLCAELCVDNVQ